MTFVFLMLGNLAAYGQPLGTVSTHDLDDAEIKSLAELLRQGACPCDKSANLLACTRDSSCPQAVDLAKYGAQKIREGLSMPEVQQAVVKKYLNDHVRYEFELEGVPFKGSKTSKVVIVEFADFQCGHCASISRTLKTLQSEFKGHVVVYFKQFPMKRHPHANYAARSALAAHEQGHFWSFHDLLFEHQTALTRSKIDGFAAQLNFDLAKFHADRESSKIYAAIDRDRREAIGAHLNATPTLYINGSKYSEQKDLKGLRRYVSELLKKDSPPADKQQK